jgi:hypothetical protein
MWPISGSLSGLIHQVSGLWREGKRGQRSQIGSRWQWLLRICGEGPPPLSPNLLSKVLIPNKQVLEKGVGRGEGHTFSYSPAFFL